jgi:hypothetical protein
MTCQHIYVSPSPAQYEDGDTARRCRECGWREHVIVLREIPPGSNQLHRMDRYAIAELRGRLKADAAYLVLESGVNGEPLEYARITLDFRWKTSVKRDPLNFAEGLKPVLDALIGKWIVDDDAAHVEAVVRGKVGTGDADHVVITVEAIR